MTVSMLTLLLMSLGLAPGALAEPESDPALEAQVSSWKVEQTGQSDRAAPRSSTHGVYVGAIRVFPFNEGYIYRLVTAPGRVSDIALEPGERLISVAAGDTVRWNVGDTTSGAGDALRTHILIKPQAADLRTNLVITTDRRVYHLALESRPKDAMIAVRWSYPADGLVVVRRETGKEVATEGAIDPADLDFGYTIHGDDPPWRPIRAFDDGRQVFIEFPDDLGSRAAPPLFVLGAGGRAELVNYRIAGHYYVVGRLFDVAELRLGEEEQDIVRVCSSGASRRACKGKGR